MARRIGSLASYFAVPTFLLVGWQILVSAGWVNARLIPGPADILQAWVTWFFGDLGSEGSAVGMVAFAGSGLDSVGASAGRVALGFSLSCAIAIPLGVSIGEWNIVRRLVDPTLQFFRPIPVTAWIPFAIVIFGIRNASAVFLVVMAAFFPLLLNSTAGVRSVPLNYIRAAQMLGARRDQIMARVVFRAALPGILTGMRLGLGFAWTSVVVAEMLAVKSGVGYVLWNSYYLFRMDQLGAAMLTMGLLGFSTDLAMRWLMRRLVGWSLRV
jgi:NitT/TauT family transport system permease protein